MKKIFICIAMLLVTSCYSYGGQNNTIEEAIAINSKTYKNTNKKEVQEALAKVFILGKNDSMTHISVNNDDVYVSTIRTLYMIIGYMRTSESLTFNLKEYNSNVEVNMYHKGGTFSNTLLIMNDYMEGTVVNPALNDLIFKRVDYLLGKTNKWYTCGEYNEYAKTNNIKGNTESICYFASDISPNSEEGKKILKDFKI